jgi:hypothetical protein
MGEVAVPPQTKPESKETFGRTRFAPGVYTLDLSAAKDMPVKANGQPSTFVAVYCDLRASAIQQMPEPFSLDIDKYVTDKGDIQLECEWPLRSTMRTLWTGPLG